MPRDIIRRRTVNEEGGTAFVKYKNYGIGGARVKKDGPIGYNNRLNPESPPTDAKDRSSYARSPGPCATICGSCATVCGPGGEFHCSGAKFRGPDAMIRGSCATLCGFGGEIHRFFAKIWGPGAVVYGFWAAMCGSKGEVCRSGA